MTIKTIIPDRKGMIYLLCPFCNANSSESGSNYPVHEVVSKHCSCGNSWGFIIEHRKAYRKKTSLPATYWKATFPTVYHTGTISDLTLDGGCLLTSTNHNLNRGEHIKLIFRLDNDEHTKIERLGVVCWTSETSVGCKFVGKPVLEPELGFYVQDFKVPK